MKKNMNRFVPPAEVRRTIESIARKHTSNPADAKIVGDTFWAWLTTARPREPVLVCAWCGDQLPLGEADDPYCSLCSAQAEEDA